MLRAACCVRSIRYGGEIPRLDWTGTSGTNDEDGMDGWMERGSHSWICNAAERAAGGGGEVRRWRRFFWLRDEWMEECSPPRWEWRWRMLYVSSLGGCWYREWHGMVKVTSGYDCPEAQMMLLMGDAGQSDNNNTCLPTVQERITVQ